MPNINTLISLIKDIANNAVKIEQLDELLKEFTGQELNQFNSDGITPLTEAVTLKQTAVLEKLLAKEGIDANVKIKKAPYVVQKRDGTRNPANALNYLLQALEKSRHPNKGITALNIAVMRGFNDGVKLLIEHNADVNYVCPGTLLEPPLIHFILQCIPRSLPMIAVLAQGNINPNLEDRSGKTALYIAAELGNVDVIKILLASNKFDINHTNKAGRTAFQIAAEKNRLDVIVAFIHHADPSTINMQPHENYKKHLIRFASNGVDIASLTKYYKLICTTNVNKANEDELSINDVCEIYQAIAKKHEINQSDSFKEVINKMKFFIAWNDDHRDQFSSINTFISTSETNPSLIFNDKKASASATPKKSKKAKKNKSQPTETIMALEATLNLLLQKSINLFYLSFINIKKNTAHFTVTDATKNLYVSALQKHQALLTKAITPFPSELADAAIKAIASYEQDIQMGTHQSESALPLNPVSSLEEEVKTDTIIVPEIKVELPTKDKSYPTDSGSSAAIPPSDAITSDVNTGLETPKIQVTPSKVEMSVETLITHIINNSLTEFNEHLATINESELDQINSDGWTPLTMAVALKRNDMISALLKKKININIFIMPNTVNVKGLLPKALHNPIMQAIIDSDIHSFNASYLAFHNADVDTMELLKEHDPMYINCDTSIENRILIAAMNERLDVLIASICHHFSIKEKMIASNDAKYLLNLALQKAGIDTLRKIYECSSINSPSAATTNMMSIQLAYSLAHIKMIDFKPRNTKNREAFTTLSNKLALYKSLLDVTKDKLSSFDSLSQFIGRIETLINMLRENKDQDDKPIYPDDAKIIVTAYETLTDALETLAMNFYAFMTNIDKAALAIDFSQNSIKEIERFIAVIDECKTLLKHLYVTHNLEKLSSFKKTEFPKMACDALSILDGKAQQILQIKKDQANAEEIKRVEEEKEKNKILAEIARQKMEKKEKKLLAKEAEEKRIAEERETKRLAKAERKKKLAEEAEKIRLKEEAEQKRIAEEEAKKRLTEKAEKMKLLAEKARLKEEAEQKRIADEKEKKQSADKAERIKKLVDEVNKLLIKEEAEKKRIIEEAKIAETRLIEAERKSLAKAAHRPVAAIENKERQEHSPNNRGMTLASGNTFDGNFIYLANKRLRMTSMLNFIFNTYFYDISQCFLVGSTVKRIYKNNESLINDYDFIGICKNPEILLKRGFVKPKHHAVGNNGTLYRLGNIDFVCLSGDNIELKEDCKTRDINLLYCDRYGNLYDPSGTELYNIDNNILTLGINAKSRIKKDPRIALRILHAMAQNDQEKPDSFLKAALYNFNAKWITNKSAFYAKLNEYLRDDNIPTRTNFIKLLTTYNISQQIYTLNVPANSAATQTHSSAASSEEPTLTYKDLLEKLKATEEELAIAKKTIDSKNTELQQSVQATTTFQQEILRLSDFFLQQNTHVAVLEHDTQFLFSENQQLKKDLISTTNQVTFFRPFGQMKILENLNQCAKEFRILAHEKDLEKMLNTFPRFEINYKCAMDYKLYFGAPTNTPLFLSDASVKKDKIESYLTETIQIIQKCKLKDVDYNEKLLMALSLSAFHFISKLAETRLHCYNHELEYVDSRLMNVFSLITVNKDLFIAATHSLKQHEDKSSFIVAKPN